MEAQSDSKKAEWSNSEDIVANVVEQEPMDISVKYPKLVDLFKRPELLSKLKHFILVIRRIKRVFPK